MLVFNGTVINVTVSAPPLHLITGELWASISDCGSHYRKHCHLILKGRERIRFSHAGKTQRLGPGACYPNAGSMRTLGTRLRGGARGVGSRVGEAWEGLTVWRPPFSTASNSVTQPNLLPSETSFSSPIKQECKKIFPFAIFKHL